ncbi:tRNA (adenine(22)-N(1))-methyltransferase TrmK [Mycoplasma wenyonii]|uniref:tRNA (adenine(22)-N(1))-methyltransferase TrmK n=1 Tax=Mycoplasma wenyonii TaxID=65123 RepID=UPI0015EBD09F|nr:tRNA (adenine(22)-N(1))-methyltransferase TrmK [Mycoplasma wenyonii]
MTPNNNFLLVDIGADLGLLGLKLLRNELISEVWNVELSKVSLKNSQKLYSEKGVDLKARFFLSDGFSELSFENIRGYKEILIVLAGLGSKKIITILEKLPEDWKTKQLWLCCLPHAYPKKIREWSRDSEWKLLKEEDFSLREKNYSIFLFSYGKVI